MSSAKLGIEPIQLDTSMPYSEIISYQYFQGEILYFQSEYVQCFFVLVLILIHYEYEP